MKVKITIIILLTVSGLYFVLPVKRESANKPVVKTNKAYAVSSGELFSVPFEEGPDGRRGEGAYMVKGQPGGNEVSWIENFEDGYSYVRFSLESNQKTNIKLNFDPEMTTNMLYPIQKDDIVWMGTGKALVKINIDTGDSEIIEIPKSNNTVASAVPAEVQAYQSISGMDMDDNGDLWITKDHVGSLFKYSQEGGFKEYKAAPDMKVPENPMVIDKGITVMDSKREVSEFELPTSQVLGDDGVWRKLKTRGVPKQSNEFGDIFAHDKSGSITIEDKKGSKTNLRLNINRFPELILALSDDAIWYNGDSSNVIKYSIKTGEKQGFAVPAEAIKYARDNYGGSAGIDEIKVGPSFNSAIVAKDGSFWASCNILGQNYIFGVPGSNQ